MLLLHNFQGQRKRYHGRDAIVRMNRDMFFKVSRFAGGIHRYLNLPHTSRIQVIRTNHRSRAASTGLDPVDYQGIRAHTVNFKYVLRLRPLGNLADVVL